MVFAIAAVDATDIETLQDTDDAIDTTREFDITIKDIEKDQIAVIARKIKKKLQRLIIQNHRL